MKRGVFATSAFRASFVLCLVFLGAPRVGPPAGSAEADDGSKAALRELRAAVNSREVESVDKAALSVARIGGARAMRGMLGILEKIPASEDALYWSVIQGVVSFVDQGAMEELGKYIFEQKSRSLARDLLLSLAGNTSPKVAFALKPTALGGSPELKILAATKLSRTSTDDSVDVLLEVLKQEDKESPGKATTLALIATEGLSLITGQSFGASPINWEGWWKKNRGKGLKSVRAVDAEAAHTGTAVDSLRVSPDLARRKAFFGLERAPLESVVVLTAIYTKKLKRDLNNDHIEKVLTHMKVPHTAVRREDFLDFNLSGTGVILINCAQFHEFCICPKCKPGGGKNNRLYKCTGCNVHIPFSAELTGAEVKKLKDFVMAGGYLFCEDWVVQEVVEKAFPGFIETNVKLAQSTVDVVPVRGMGGHPYLRGVFEPKIVEPPILLEDEDSEEGGEDITVVVQAPKPDGEELPEVETVKVKHSWTIDDESYAVKVVDKNRVLSVLGSGDLQKTTNGNGVVALAFRPGSGAASKFPLGQRAPRGTPGVVFVVLSHFGKQESTADEHSIENLLLNFLIEANAAREGRAGAARKASGAKKEKDKEKD